MISTRFAQISRDFFRISTISPDVCQECRAHATQQLDIALASLREPLGPPGPAKTVEEDDLFGGFLGILGGLNDEKMADLWLIYG